MSKHPARPHEVDFFRLHDGKTVADLKRWRKENPGGPAPADALGGALEVSIKRVVSFERISYPDATCSTARCP